MQDCSNSTRSRYTLSTGIPNCVHIFMKMKPDEKNLFRKVNRVNFRSPLREWVQWISKSNKGWLEESFSEFQIEKARNSAEWEDWDVCWYGYNARVNLSPDYYLWNIPQPPSKVIWMAYASIPANYSSSVLRTVLWWLLNVVESNNLKISLFCFPMKYRDKIWSLLKAILHIRVFHFYIRFHNQMSVAICH